MKTPVWFGLVTTQMEYQLELVVTLIPFVLVNHQDTNPHQEHLQFQSMLGTIKLGPTYNSVLL